MKSHYTCLQSGRNTSRHFLAIVRFWKARLNVIFVVTVTWSLLIYNLISHVLFKIFLFHSTLYWKMQHCKLHLWTKVHQDLEKTCTVNNWEYSWWCSGILFISWCYSRALLSFAHNFSFVVWKESRHGNEQLVNSTYVPKDVDLFVISFDNMEIVPTPVAR